MPLLRCEISRGNNSISCFRSLLSMYEIRAVLRKEMVLKTEVKNKLIQDCKNYLTADKLHMRTLIACDMKNH